MTKIKYRLTGRVKRFGSSKGGEPREGHDILVYETKAFDIPVKCKKCSGKRRHASAFCQSCSDKHNNILSVYNVIPSFSKKEDTVVAKISLWGRFKNWLTKIIYGTK